MKVADEISASRSRGISDFSATKRFSAKSEKLRGSLFVAQLLLDAVVIIRDLFAIDG